MGARMTEADLQRLNVVEPDRRFSKPRITKQEIQDKLELERIREKTRRAQSLETGIPVSGKLKQKADVGIPTTGNSIKKGERESSLAIKVDIKPITSNRAWQGRRFKSKQYIAYSKMVLALLPAINLPAPPYLIEWEFGFSNKLSDLDNPIKSTQDLICQKYGFNDRDIYELNVRKKIVRKGEEYFKFRISTLG